MTAIERTGEERLPVGAVAAGALDPDRRAPIAFAGRDRLLRPPSATRC